MEHAVKMAEEVTQDYLDELIPSEIELENGKVVRLTPQGNPLRALEEFDRND